MFTFFEKLIEPFPGKEPDRPPNTLVAFCLHYCRDAWPWLLLLSLLSAIVAVIEVVLVGYLGKIVDVLAAADRGESVFGLLPGLGLILLVMLVVYPALSLLHTLLLHQTLLGNLPMIIRWQAHRYLLRQSIQFFNNEFAGRIGTKVMQTSLAVRETVLKLLDILVYVSVYFVSICVLVAAADIRMLLPLLIWLAFYLAVLRWFIPRLQSVSQVQADARSIMTGRVVDSYTNISTVKLFSHAGNEAHYAKQGMSRFLGTVHKQMRLSSGIELCVDISTMLLLAATGAYSIYLWQADLVSVGAIAVAIGVVVRLRGIAHWIMWEMSALFENIGVVHDGIATLSVQQDVTDKPDAEALDKVRGSIQFADVSFGYGRPHAILDDLSLNIKAGEKIGLVGPSGAGKTTLVNLLLRLYDPDSGKIFIDGRDISALTQDSLRQNVGVVTQDTSLLHRSIAENIGYGTTSSTLEEIERASRRADAFDFILDLEDAQGRTGFDAHVGERGVRLSGGQRQRISIARVFLKDAPILVLDEATSALDSEVEAAIQENLLELMQGKTVLAIAHRLSTIAMLDRLIVMQNGKIVEQGSHEDLVSSGGLYSRLWARQSGGFLTF